MIGAATIGAAGGNKRKPPKVVQEIVAEASRHSTQDPIGRPLPLASTWQAGGWGTTAYAGGYTPLPEPVGTLYLTYQMDLIRAGHHWMPTVSFPMQSKLTKQFDPINGSSNFCHGLYYEQWDQLAEWGLPVTFYTTNWEAALHNYQFLFNGGSPEWINKRPSNNPCVVKQAGFYSGTLSANAVVTTAGSSNVVVTLADTTDIAVNNYFWFTQPLSVGGCNFDERRYQITAVDGNDITIVYWESVDVYGARIPKNATGNASGGGVTYETALLISNVDSRGPLEHWYQCGQYWLGTRREPFYNQNSPATELPTAWDDLTDRYPGPSRVLFLSNNEETLQSVTDVLTNKKFLDTYGDVASDSSRQTLIIQDYVDRYGQLIAGVKDSVETYAPAWKHKGICLGYNDVFEWRHGRAGDWRSWRPYYGANGDLCYFANAWEGASPECYLNHSEVSIKRDYFINSMQSEFSNVAWQLPIVYAINPNFWYEMSVWNGWFTEHANNPVSNAVAYYAQKIVKSVYDTQTLAADAVYAEEGNYEYIITITANADVVVGDLFIIGSTGFTVLGVPFAANDSWAITQVDSPTQIRIVRLSAPAEGQGTGTGGGQQYKLGKPELFSGVRFKNFIRYCMWETFPRVVRHFVFESNAKMDDPEFSEYFYGLLEAVDEVYADETLKRFWRKGTLLFNPGRRHPYRASVTPEWGDGSNTWTLLECDANIAMPVSDTTTPSLTQEIHVWCLALVLGETPNREWLVYAYSPRQDRTNVTITVPGYGDILLDVPQAGVFHYVAEAA